MKRFFRIFAVAALACATIVACDNKFDDYDPAEKVEGAQAYFSNESATSYTISRIDVAPITITVMRGETESALSLPITLSQGEEGAFSAPEKAEFKAGQNKTTINLTYDPEKLADGASYKVTLAIGDQSATTPYGNNVMTLTIKVPEPYVLLGKGLYREDLMTGIFTSVESTEYEVEIYENLNTPGYIYLKNAYTSLFPYNEPGDYVEGDVYLAINVKDPNDVFLPQQELGLNWGYGAVKVGTKVAGTLVDKIITFPANAFLLSMADYNGGAWSFYGNPNGLFRVALPGAVLSDFSMQMAYAGMNVDTNYEAKPVIDVVFGADVAKIAYAVVPGNIVYDEEGMATALAGIEDGSIELTVVDAVDQIDDEEELLQMQLVGAETLEEGLYTMVAIPMNAEEEMQMGDVATVAFYMNAVNSEVPEMDFKSGLFPFTALFGEVPGYDDSSCVAWLAMGSNIKAWKQLMAPYAVFEPFLEKGITLEQLVLANGTDYEDLQYINTDGQDYGYYTGLDAETAYLMVHYVEDVFGNVKTVGNLITTAPAPEAEEDTEATAKVYRKLDTANITFKAGQAMKVWNK